MSSVPLGLLLLVLAGGMNGSFTLPMKFTRQWAWENTWLVWTLFALGLFPPLLTFSTVPVLGQVYAQAGVGPILTVRRAARAGAFRRFSSGWRSTPSGSRWLSP